MDDLTSVVEELPAPAIDRADEAVDQRLSAAYHHVVQDHRPHASERAARRRRRTSSRVGPARRPSGRERVSTVPYRRESSATALRRVP